jgi:hypothetical protein
MEGGVLYGAEDQSRATLELIGSSEQFFMKDEESASFMASPESHEAAQVALTGYVCSVLTYARPYRCIQ